jgi:lysophospholipase L1-like esterase
MGNLEAIYDKAREAGTAVVLLSGPPWRCYRNVPAASWARHEAVRARAGRGVSDGYVDLYALWGDGEACIRREYDAGDRLHPNAAGRRLLARHIAGMLSR